MIEYEDGVIVIFFSAVIIIVIYYNMYVYCDLFIPSLQIIY